MAKVITLSRKFQATHPKAGHPTYFVEKVWRSLTDGGMSVFGELMDYQKQYDDRDTANHEIVSISTFAPKHHTIRSGKRWKDGEMASLRVWSDKPYNSPQITIAPEVKLRVVDIKIYNDWNTFIDGKLVDKDVFDVLAVNDGLCCKDLLDWFGKIGPHKLLDGQLLIWNTDNLPY